MLDWLESKHGRIRTTRRKVYTYFGIKLDYTNPGEVKVSMMDYLKETIASFPEMVNRSVIFPAGDHLFETNAECKK